MPREVRRLFKNSKSLRFLFSVFYKSLKAPGRVAPCKLTNTFNKGKARCLNYYGLYFLYIASAALLSDVYNFTITCKTYFNKNWLD